MEHLKVKGLTEICEQLGLALGHAKWKHVILEIMMENVTTEEVNEAWAEIKERREREEAEKKELRYHEDTERLERREEAERQEQREEA